jgi:Hypothetical glycosyl hydrolase family 15
LGALARVLSTLAVGTALALFLVGNLDAAGRRQTVAGTGLLRTGHLLTSSSGRSRAALLIVSKAQASAAAREPGRSLVYFAGTVVNRRWNFGVPYAQAKRNGWLLTDSSGHVLVSRSYPDNDVVDVGNRAYQRAWLRGVTRFLKAHHDDGLMIDNVLADIEPLAEAQPAAYPTQRAWAAAQLSFIRAVCPPLRARGYYVLVNASGYVPGNPASDTGQATASWWRRLAPYVDGMMNEYYQEIPTGSDELRSTGASWTQNWAGWQRLVEVAQSQGRDFVGLTYGAPGDTRTMTYGKASFLLDWNGRGGAFVYESKSDANPWNGAWTLNVGRPAGKKRRIGVGWLRRYGRGVVLVNPSPSSAQRFALPGRYAAAGGGALTEVTVPPTSGLILRAVTR